MLPDDLSTIVPLAFSVAVTSHGAPTVSEAKGELPSLRVKRPSLGYSSRLL